MSTQHTGLLLTALLYVWCLLNTPVYCSLHCCMCGVYWTHWSIAHCTVVHVVSTQHTGLLLTALLYVWCPLNTLVYCSLQLYVWCPYSTHWSIFSFRMARLPRRCDFKVIFVQCFRPSWHNLIIYLVEHRLNDVGLSLSDAMWKIFVVLFYYEN